MRARGDRWKISGPYGIFSFPEVVMYGRRSHGLRRNGLPRIRRVIEPAFWASFLNIVVRSEQGHRHRMHVLPDRSIASIRQRVSPDAVGERDETGKFYRRKKKLFPVRRIVFLSFTKSCFFAIRAVVLKSIASSVRGCARPVLSRRVSLILRGSWQSKLHSPRRSTYDRRAIFFKMVFFIFASCTKRIKSRSDFDENIIRVIAS